jgi:hypothetical protein
MRVITTVMYITATVRVITVVRATTVEAAMCIRTSGSRRTKMSGVSHTGNIFPHGLIDFSAL